MTATLVGKVLRRIRKHGFKATWGYFLARLDEITFDRRFGIRTRGYVSLPTPYLLNSNYHSYTPSRHVDFKEAMKHVDVRESHDVFLDFGSGMGRVLILASMYPFKRVIGVEINHELNCLAERNFRNFNSKLKCKDRSIITLDASLFSIPNDVTVVFFNNPFKSVVLERVVSNIYESLLEYPREMTIIFGGPRDFERMIQGMNWIKKIAEFRLIWPFAIYRTNIQVVSITNKDSPSNRAISS